MGALTPYAAGRDTTKFKDPTPNRGQRCRWGSTTSRAHVSARAEQRRTGYVRCRDLNPVEAFTLTAPAGEPPKGPPAWVAGEPPGSPTTCGNRNMRRLPGGLCDTLPGLASYHLADSRLAHPVLRR